MVFIIDEDEIQMRPFMLELALRGIDAEQLLTADEALRRASHFGREDIFLVDVMLAVDVDAASSVFSRTSTDDYKITGLQLVDVLRKERPDLPPRNFILMSQAASSRMKDVIRRFASTQGVAYISKSAYDDPLTFGEEIQKKLPEGGR